MGPSTTGTVFAYAGQYTDAESGLQYLRARYYDPSTGQFLTVDPSAGVTGQPYSYAADDVPNVGDPSGTCPFCVIATTAGIGAAAGSVSQWLQNALDPCHSSGWQGVAKGAALGAIGGGLAEKFPSAVFVPRKVGQVKDANLRVAAAMATQSVETTAFVDAQAANLGWSLGGDSHSGRRAHERGF